MSVGVIGSGFAARTVVAASRRSDLVSEVLVTGGSRVTELRDRYGARPVASVDTMLDLVDVVVVATPHDSHVTYIEQALQRGLHVLSEKPLVTEVADGERLVALAESRGLVLSVNHFQRYRAPNAAVAAHLRDSPPVTGGRARLVEAPAAEPWKHSPSNRGFLLGYGVHVVDLLLWWLGAPCTQVKATQLGKAGVERCTAATLMFEGGAHVSLVTSDLGRGSGVTSQPGRALLDFELLTASGLLDIDSYGEAVLRTLAGPVGLGSLDTWDDFDSPVRLAAYVEALEQFLRACVDDVQPELTARDALDAIRVCDAMGRSATEGGRVTWVS